MNNQLGSYLMYTLSIIYDHICILYNIVLYLLIIYIILYIHPGYLGELSIDVMWCSSRPWQFVEGNPQDGVTFQVFARGTDTYTSGHC